MTQLLTIPFRNQTLIAIEHHGKPYVAMRPIVENLGLDWKSQYVKITERFERCVVIITTRDALGRMQNMLCLPIQKIAGFLYSISPSKVKPELRDNIIAYQEECDEVLYRHFSGREKSKAHYLSDKNQQLEVKNRTLADYAFRNIKNYRAIANAIGLNIPARMIAQANNVHVSTVNRLKKRLLTAGLLH